MKLPNAIKTNAISTSIGSSTISWSEPMDLHNLYADSNSGFKTDPKMGPGGKG